jgi:hypothetical protein
LGPDAEELVDLILQPLAAQWRRSRRIEGVEAQRAVVRSAERAADREILDRHLQHVGQGIDVNAPAREAPRRIDRKRLRVGVTQRKGVAGISIGIAECDDPVDLLRGGRGGGKRQ